MEDNSLKLNKSMDLLKVVPILSKIKSVDSDV